MSYKKTTPIGDKLLVLPLKKEEEKLESGVVLAETVNADLTTGVVIEVSKELENLFAKGDTILFPTGSGTGMYYQAQHVLWLRAGEIWGTVTKSETPS